MKDNNETAGQMIEAARASELINDLANGFEAAAPELQQKGLAAMTELIEATSDETSRNRLIYYRSIFEFVQAPQKLDAGEH